MLNALPKSVHGKAKKNLHAIYEAEKRVAAETAFDRFTSKYGAKYDSAVTCLAKDRAALLAFYDFPAKHWKHLRSSNPIESTFATVRLRTDKTKDYLSRETALAMVFKLAKTAERHWRRLDGAGSMAPTASASSSRASSSTMARPFKTPRSKPLPDAHTPRLTIARPPRPRVL